MKKYFSEFGETPTMDNAEPTPVEIAWLAGIFDGEGSVILQRRNGTDRRASVGFHITNSDMSMLSKCQSILQRITNRPVVLHKKKMYDYSTVKSNLDIYTIDLRKQSDLSKIFTLLLPHLTAKRRKSEMVLEYVNLRISEIKRTGKNNQMTEASLILSDSIFSKWRGVETERKALGNEMKPQSELYSNIQNPAEMSGSLVN
jgi:hypothetical protein